MGGILLHAHAHFAPDFSISIAAYSITINVNTCSDHLRILVNGLWNEGTVLGSTGAMQPKFIRIGDALYMLAGTSDIPKLGHKMRPYSIVLLASIMI